MLLGVLRPSSFLFYDFLFVLSVLHIIVRCNLVQVEQSRARDLAPTILKKMDVPVPNDMDGCTYPSSRISALGSVAGVEPVVTIGVCVKDCGKSIGETVESIMAQDFPHNLMEVIFVDDGSKDETLAMISKCTRRIDIPVKVYHDEWKGLGSARNTVVRNARGDYILWVDGDMILPADHVRKQIEYMEQNPKVGIAKATYGMSSKESLIAFLENIADVAKDAIMEDEWNTDLKLPGTGGSIYRAKAIKEVGGFDDNLKRVGEDQDAAYRIKKAGWLIHKTKAIFYERRRLESWKTLWDKHFRYGYDHYRLYRKNRGLFIFYKMNPLASFIAGLLYSIIAYRLTNRIAVFLLPFQYAFKMTAWSLGFIKSQMNFDEV